MVGIGGLGHLAVRFAAALGATVTVVTRSPDKAAEAHALGADRTLVSTSTEAMAAAASSFDVIIDTIPVRHDVSPYVDLLDLEGVLVIVGQLGDMDGFSSLPLLAGRRRITGSPAGGIAETQEMLDFCAKAGVLPDCETVAMAEVQRSLRAPGARRCPLSLRHRHGRPDARLSAPSPPRRETPMKIGVIGAGLIGGAVARLARAAGHEVRIANSRGPKSLADLARQIGAEAVTAHEAALAEDIVILSIPQRAVASLPRDLFTATPASAAIVDTGNYYPRTRDGFIPEIEAGWLDSEWVSERIGRPVVKAFNMLKANSLANGAAPGTPGRIAIALAGDDADADAKAKVARLIDDIGFDPVDAGPLSESWRLQPGTLGYCHDYDALTLGAALAATDGARIADYRRDGDAFGGELVKRLGSVDAVGRARS